MALFDWLLKSLRADSRKTILKRERRRRFMRPLVMERLGERVVFAGPPGNPPPPPPVGDTIIGGPWNGIVVLPPGNGSGGVGSPDGLYVTVSVDNSLIHEIGTPKETYFRFSRSSSVGALQVDYALRGEAELGIDYTISENTLGSVYFAPGVQTVSLKVATIDDLVYDPSETIRAEIYPGPYNIVNGIAITTIVDNEIYVPPPTVSLSVDTHNISEANTNAPATFTVSRSDNSGPLTVYYQLNGSADYLSDYIGPNASTGSGLPLGSVTIPDGQYSTTFQAFALNDTDDDDGEFFQVMLTDASGYLIGSGSQNVRIIDNDDTPPPPAPPPVPYPTVTVSVDRASISENATNTPAIFTIARDSTLGDLVVNYAFYGNATIVSDYTAPGAASASVTIPAGQSSVAIAVYPVNDTIDDDAEEASLGLRVGEGYVRGTPSNASVTIIDNDGDPLPKVRINSDRLTIAEANPSVGVTYTITRDGPTTLPLEVRYWLGGTAQQYTDYSGPSEPSVIIPAGQSSTTLTFYPIDDTVDDNNELIFGGLYSTSEYTIDPWDTVGTRIIDNDGAPESNLPYVGIAVNKNSIEEANPSAPATFTIRRDDASTGITVNYFVSGINAVNGQTSYATYGDDFTTNPALGNTSSSGAIQSVYMPAGLSSVNITVGAINDVIPEIREYMYIAVTAGTGYRLVSSLGNSESVDVVDDDGPPTVTIVTKDGAASEVNNDSGKFEIRLSKAMPDDLTIRLTPGGTADKFADYRLMVDGTLYSNVSTYYTITIPAGKTVVEAFVIPSNDNLDEPTEIASFNLYPWTGMEYVIGSPPAADIHIEDGFGIVTVRVAGDKEMPEDLGYDDWDGAGREFDFVVEVWGSSNDYETYTLNWAGTATRGGSDADYTADTTSITVYTSGSGVGTKHVYAHVNPDLVYEGDPDESIILQVVGSTDSRSNATAWILNDDDRFVNVQIADSVSKSTNEFETEVLPISVKRNHATLAQTVFVNIDSATTATRGIDYQIYLNATAPGDVSIFELVNSTLLSFTFAAGSDTALPTNYGQGHYELKILNDREIDGGQHFVPGDDPGDLPDEIVKLQVVKDANMKGAGSATVSIQDDDKHTLVNSQILYYWPPPRATNYLDKPTEGGGNWIDGGDYWERSILRYGWQPENSSVIRLTGKKTLTEGEVLGQKSVNFSQTLEGGISIGPDNLNIPVGGAASISWSGSWSNGTTVNFYTPEDGDEVPGETFMPAKAGYDVGFLPLVEKQYGFKQRVFKTNPDLAPGLPPPEDAAADGMIEWEQESNPIWGAWTLYYSTNVGAALYYVPVAP